VGVAGSNSPRLLADPVAWDNGFGNENIMREAEQRELAYLFKLRLMANVKRAIARLFRTDRLGGGGPGLAGQGNDCSVGWLEPGSAASSCCGGA